MEESNGVNKFVSHDSSVDTPWRLQIQILTTTLSAHIGPAAASCSTTLYVNIGSLITSGLETNAGFGCNFLEGSVNDIQFGLSYMKKSFILAIQSPGIRAPVLYLLKPVPIW